ncbi:hypothetical protein Q3G72_030495 [Acer saccharum]|nr:hypothetical protein Q3G72_030495 [Acer saccharum]
MKKLSLVFLVCIVYGSLIYGFTGSYAQVQGVDSEYKSESSVTYKYDRIDEVKKQCASVLSSATELKPEDNKIYSIKDELNVRYGDWFQDIGEAPIMPFDDREIPTNSSQTPLNIASFWVTDIDRAHRSKKYVSVSGELLMSITLEMSYADEKSLGGNRQFQIWPSHTELSVVFQGIYTESKKNGGERVLCLLGTAMLPSRDSDSGNPWEWVKGSNPNYYQPPLLQDDQILLVLRSPMTFTLTNRVIRGEISSLNSKSNSKYFDKVHILSQFGRSTHYEFGSEKIVSKACDPYPYQDSFIKGGIDIYKGIGFCEVLEQITSEGVFTVVPNWKCNSTDAFCSKLGPFGSNKVINRTDGGFKDVKIVMQNVKCEQTHGRGNASSAKVAAVFRVATPSENQYSSVWRSGVGNMTVASEGLWKSSSGQLCMVGCLGLADAEGSTCDSRICLYIPLSFSIKQRSIIVGSFSSIKSNPSYWPLSIEKLVQPTELWNYFRTSNVHYSYSKINAAAVVLENNEAFSFRTVIKKSLLQFPKLEDSEAFLSSLSLLSEDLTLHISAVPDPFPKSRPPRTDIQMEILSVGPLFGRYWSSSNNSTQEEETPYHTKAEYTEMQLLLNVSAQLSLTGDSYSNFSRIFLEGLYDPHVGKMYLVGCRDVRASWKILFESNDLEAGLDCLIEVVVSYPPTTSRWLVNPTARISIASRRSEDDPLYFNSIKLQTFPIMYRKQREDILSRRGIEGILRILTLSFAIGCIVSQLFYIKHNLDSVPFMSLVMLGVQALGYSLPLITGAEALFKRAASESDEMNSYNLEKSQWFKVIDSTVKLLVMVSFLLTLRLCQKVWKSRIRLLTRSPLEPHRVPSEKRVLLTTLTIHVIGYILVLIIHSSKTRQRQLRTNTFVVSAESSHMLPGWETELEEYVGLVQDFYLLPQVIGNIMWQIDCKPLRKLYFIGITAVRLLPHVYDYIRSPVPNPYFNEEYEFANPSLDFYSKFGDIAIPVTAVFLAAVVYIQQRWGYEKLNQMLTFGRYKLLPSPSRAYERLPSKYVEAELTSDVNRNDQTHGKEHDDEE